MTFITRPRSCLMVLSGPCGTGKTSLAMALLESEENIHYTRSVTTRGPRDGTVPETHYDHVTRDEFLQMTARGDFVQWLHPGYDEYYGTRRAPIDEAIELGRDMVFDYCPEGYLNLRRMYPEQTVGVFVMTPDVATMRSRLEGRGTEAPEELTLRYEMALQDFNFVDQHDYHVINDDLDRTLETIRSIYHAERARLCRQRGVIARYAQAAQPALLRYYRSPGT